LADYIPELAGVDPSGFGMSLSFADGFVYESGDTTTQFSIQSIAKPFNDALALNRIGATSPDERFAVIQDFYSAFAGRRLELDPDVYASEKATGSRNRAIG
jgi:glutaminase